MKTLVTGANGFLASNIVRELLKRGYPVRAMMRRGSDQRSLEGVKCDFFYGNITDADDVVKAAKGCTYIIHAAANTSQVPGYKSYVPVNIQGTANIIEACKVNNCKRIVYISTANVFGPGTKDKPGDEGIPMAPQFKKSGYALSKANAQQMILQAVKENIIDAVVINPSFMLGPHDAKPSSGKIIRMFYGKKIVFVPPGGKNFVDVRDVAAGTIQALENGRPGECYLLVGRNMSYAEFVRMLNTNKPGIIRLPKPILYGAGLLGDFLNFINIPVQLSLNNARILCTENYYTAQKAIRELNLPQTSVEKSIEDAIAWFKEHDMLKRPRFIQ